MKKKDVRLALVFKDFAAWCRSSCVGLHVAGFATKKVLEQHGYSVSVFPVRHNVDVVHAIDTYNETHDERLTHVVISAPWLSLHDMRSLLYGFPEIQFVVLSHSNVGFLQADPCGVGLLRRYHELTDEFHNFRVGGNSEKFVRWMESAYGGEAVLLPNLYPLGDQKIKDWSGLPPIKVGAFGALRSEKNFMTAAAAAVALQSEIGMEVELHMSAGGEEEQSLTSQAINQMCEGKIKIIRHPWAYWDSFIGLVESMDVLLQVSYTESFNMITADGVSVGIPSVVSPAIYWAPPSWKVDADDVNSVVKAMMRLLVFGKERNEGYRYLQAHNLRSLHYWDRFLLNEEKEETWYQRIKRFFTI